jgi:hypothetical protein
VRTPLAVLATVLVAGTACGGATPGVRVEPAVVRLSPALPDAPLEIVNAGPDPVEIADLRLEGPDWGAFSVDDDGRLPARVGPGERLQLSVRAGRRGLRTAASQAYADYRAGDATLAFRAGDTEHRVPVRFSPVGRASTSLWAAGLAALGLLGALGLAGRVGPRASGRPPAASPILAAIGLAVALAVLPIGEGLCDEPLAEMLYAEDLARCRAGAGGSPLALAPVDGGLVAWCAGLFGAALAGARARVESAAAAVITLCVASLAVSAGTSDPTTLVLAQRSASPIAGIPALGLVSQPLAFVLAVLASSRLEGPALGLRGVAVVSVALFFAGCFALVPPGPPGPSIAAGLLSVGVGVVAIGIGAEAMRRAARGQGSLARVAGVGWPTILAVAAANLAVTVAAA